MKPETGNLTRLLEEVQSSTKVFLDYLKSQNLPEPSFENGDGINPQTPPPQEVLAARNSAIYAADELHQLLLGPLRALLNSPGDQYLLLGLQYIYRTGLAYKVPSEDSITFKKLAETSGQNLKDLTRFLRLAMTRHVFSEPVKGSVAHTATSRLLLNNPMLQSWLLNIAEEFWPSLTRTVDAIKQWPNSEEPNETGYSLSHNTTENPFDVIKKDPKRQQQFVDAMSFSHIEPSFNMSHLIDNYDFGGIENGIVVDVGGSHGQVSIKIAEKFPHVKCIVQDLPDVIAGLDARVPEGLKDRIEGMEYDFLTPQPVKGADFYVLRWILHDWSDKYAVKILQNLIPGLKKGSKVVVNDICIPEPGQLGIGEDRDLRIMDISMKAFNNARERDAETWASLFAEADPRFKFLGISIPAKARMAIIQAEWTGE